VIERTPALNRHGRGQIFHFSIKHTPKTKRLIKAMEGAGKRRG
jgi:hypothetical protein